MPDGGTFVRTPVRARSPDDRAALADQARSYRALWRGVILQSLRDAQGIRLLVGGEGAYRANILRAREWFDSAECVMVCELADLCHRSVRGLAAAVARGEVDLRFCGVSSGNQGRRGAQ